MTISDILHSTFILSILNSMNKSQVAQAIKITSPVFFGYLAIGIPFGLMLVKGGYPWWLAPIMSVSMYAGAGQYAAIGLFAAGASLSEIAITMLLVNIRHIVYGLSLITPFKNMGKWRWYVVFALTDETYALLTSTSVPQGAHTGSFYGLIALLDHSYWVLGGVIGAVAGMLIPFSFDGIDFALTALFVVLLLEQIKKSRDFVPPVIGFVCGILAVLFVPTGNMLIASLSASIVLLALLRGKKGKTL